MMKPKPFIKWLGGKRTIANIITAHMPSQIEHYVEPFLGGGAIYYNMHNRVKQAYLNDLNSELMITYQVIKDKTLLPQLIKLYNYHVTNNCKGYYIILRDHFNKTDNVSIAARFIYINKSCFKGMYRVNSKGRFNTAFGSDSPPFLEEDYFEAIAECLQKAKLTNKSYKDIKPFRGAVVYVDPPYDGVWTAYTKEGFNRKDQIELSDWCNEWTKLGSLVLVSNSSTDFIEDIYGGWKCVPIQKTHTMKVTGKQPKIKEHLFIKGDDK